MNSLNRTFESKIWFPFTNMLSLKKPLRIIRGKGVHLYDENNCRYIDAVSSWWVNLHGHCHPEIVKTLKNQASKLEHVLMAGFTNEPAEKLALSLLNILPGNFSKVFYSDNGSTSVEVALRIAAQFHINENRKHRIKIISFLEGYHGDTLGAFSAAKNCFNKIFHNQFFQNTISIDYPGSSTQSSLIQLKNALKQKDVAAFIFEPLILGAGGMRTYSIQLLDEMIGLCREENVVTIADEVMTGFGRTGPLFACNQLKNSPDIICLSKGITGGFLPLGATACNYRIFQTFLSHDSEKTFFYGHSYTGNPLSCSCANTNLRLLTNSNCTAQRHLIESSHQNFASSIVKHPNLKRCEVLGTILIIECRDQLHPDLSTLFLKQGIIIRPLGQVLYVMPPYCITRSQLNIIYKTITSSLEWKL